MTPREKFIRLIRDDILRLGDATLDFGIYRILNFRRAAITRYLEETLPALVSSQLARLPGAEASEETRIYVALTDFFSRYYEGGDFVMKARRGRPVRCLRPRPVTATATTFVMCCVRRRTLAMRRSRCL
jgi:adenine-specific DNA-methyltransferase